jgi:phosphoribosylamine--glycine ligase
MNRMKILIVGGGGREHALAWKAAQSRLADAVYVAPGNAGTAREDRVNNVAIDPLDIERLIGFAKDNEIGLTIVGPEGPLVAGIVDAFRAEGLRCFGPTAAAAQLEGSKAFAKSFLSRHGIPTASYGVFSQVGEAHVYIEQHPTPMVVKADGLAAGKGVIIAQSRQEAIRAVEDMLEGNAFGDAGHRVVIEEFLTGEEASFIVMSDGVGTLAMASSQDHKALDDGDKGPNTGGMGAYSPAPVVTPQIHERVMREVIEPTVRGMAADGKPYVGFLYAGLMISPDGAPRVLEFNCRFGDPETQPIMMRLRSDLVSLCLAALEGRLATATAEWDPRSALGVVLAAGGYPGKSMSGDLIEGLPINEEPDVKIFHAGTALKDGKIVTAGGRVLCVCALGDTVSMAQRRAYATVRGIHWNNMHFRTDIGYRAIAREAGDA